MLFMVEQKPWVGFDLDGTLAVYDTWEGPNHIGEPIPAMINKIKEYITLGVKVKIFTARVCSTQTPEHIAAAKETIRQWTLKYIGVEVEATAEKDWYMLEYYDDRAIQVRYNTGVIIE